MNTNDLQEIELTGTPRERGRKFGETAKDKIIMAVSRWKSNLGKFSNETIPDHVPEQYLQCFFSETAYIDPIKKWTPRLYDEVVGISEASGVPFNEILGLNLMDEEWIFGAGRDVVKGLDKCTAFALASKLSMPGYAGQNMDIGSWVDGSQVLLRVAETEYSPEILVFSIAGSIGLNGVNAEGLGVTCNTLLQLSSSKSGLPVQFITRSLLELSNIDEAIAFLHTVKHASGQNFILSSKDRVVCFECSSCSVMEYPSEDLPDSFRLFHTNHPLVSQSLAGAERAIDRSGSSILRLDSISRRLARPDIYPGITEIKAALSAHDDAEFPVSRNTNIDSSVIGFTAGSSIYEYSSHPKLHLAAGPPCESDYREFSFRKYGES